MYKNCLKRVIDFLLSLIGIVVLSPVLLVLAIIIKVTSPGLYSKQEKNRKRYIS